VPVPEVLAALNHPRDRKGRRMTTKPPDDMAETLNALARGVLAAEHAARVMTDRDYIVWSKARRVAKEVVDAAKAKEAAR
jgi:hypothetical protein